MTLSKKDLAKYQKRYSEDNLVKITLNIKEGDREIIARHYTNYSVAIRKVITEFAKTLRRRKPKIQVRLDRGY